MQPQLSQRPQKQHSNTSRNEDKAPSHSHIEELQRAWQYVGLQEGCALLSTTCPVSEHLCQMIRTLAWHGLLQAAHHCSPAGLAQHSPAVRCPWVPAEPAKQETAQTQAGPSHQCSTPGVLVTCLLPWEPFPTAQSVLVWLCRVQFQGFASTMTCQGLVQSPHSSQLCGLPWLNQDGVEHAHLTLLVLELSCSLRRALAPVRPLTASLPVPQH